MATDRRLRGTILPVAFVIAGVLLLLNTLDLVTWSVWPQLVRLWPIVVIGFGAHLLWQHFRRTNS